jgi:hypothetical protein
LPTSSGRCSCAASLTSPGLQFTPTSPDSPCPVDSSLDVCPPISLGSSFCIQRLIATISSFSVPLTPSR